MVTLISKTRPGPAPVLAQPTELGPVSAWSISTLEKFEQCAYQIYISKVKKIKEEQGEAAARGEQVHLAAQQYVEGTREDLIPELKKYADKIEQLKIEYAKGNVENEGEWGFTIDWQKTGWISPDVWARVKLDVYVRVDEHSARVIDYKTGKKFGNETKHGQQGLLYAIAAFMRDPNLQFVDVEFWYTDQKLEDATKKSYTREQALMFHPGFHNRGVKMTTEKDFEPNPSKMNCLWCAFKKGEHPECRWGVK